MKGQIPEWLSGVNIGWRGILETLHGELLAVCPDYQVSQVKEKFGGLRVYLNAVVVDDSAQFNAVHALVRLAEERSYRTCEWCGEPGEERGGGWIKTLCDGCHDKRQARRT